jgi:hypothetical protein
MLRAELGGAARRALLAAAAVCGPGPGRARAVGAKDLAAAQCWMWDEAEQHISMCSGIGLTRAYVEAVQAARSTKGIPMSMIQQLGRLHVVSISSGECLLDETIMCPLNALASNNTNCTVQAMQKYRKWNSESTTPFAQSVRFQVQVMVSDGHSACDKTKRFEISRPTPHTHTLFFLTAAVSETVKHTHTTQHTTHTHTQHTHTPHTTHTGGGSLTTRRVSTPSWIFCASVTTSTWPLRTSLQPSTLTCSIAGVMRQQRRLLRLRLWQRLPRPKPKPRQRRSLRLRLRLRLSRDLPTKAWT